ncbi:PRD domain-containing protein [Bifidobacterium sp. SMB2]|uniref:PRD domain-containing protein n=1 Tax=Bifidobacterium saimiriisciurei TaxID=2661627 RepID=A0ABX0C7Z5_9BIFI|nr:MULTISPECIES: PRD domain-containing protein [Bifidobacterium]NEG95199.1 PRD domain-containing protein [Bifidobacterium sp. SMB2]NEH11276.1 PRD domain-containing protein [Bifidobacterium saimiriisciurei]
MEILRVFNNNVVLAKDDDGTEIVLTGRGIGFQGKPGKAVDETKIVRRFVPSDGRDPDHLAQMLAGIEPETVRLVIDALHDAGLEGLSGNTTVIASLSDHVDNALRRLADDTHVTYPLRAEVSNLYPDEFAQGQRLLAAINTRLAAAGRTTLPDGETTALAMHLVNAGFATGDLSYTYTMTGVIQQMMTIIEATFNIVFDRDSVNVSRFITHVRYLFVRIRQNNQLADEPAPIIHAITQSYPRAMQCAQRIAAVLEMRLDANLTQDEIAYLALHIARVSGISE